MFNWSTKAFVALIGYNIFKAYTQAICHHKFPDWKYWLFDNYLWHSGVWKIDTLEHHNYADLNPPV